MLAINGTTLLGIFYEIGSMQQVIQHDLALVHVLVTIFSLCIVLSLSQETAALRPVW